MAEDNLDDFRLDALRYLMGEGDYGNRSRFPQPQLILSDLKMPRMDGLELLKWVRAKAATGRIPFIMLSSSNQPNDVTRAYDCCVNSYLFKPGTPGCD